MFLVNLKAVPRLMMLHIESLDYFDMLVFFPALIVLQFLGCSR